MYIYFDAEALTDDQYSNSTAQLQKIMDDSTWIRADDFDEVFQANLPARKWYL